MDQQMRFVFTFFKYIENYFILKSVIKVQSFKMWNWTSSFGVLLSSTFLSINFKKVYIYIYIDPVSKFFCVVSIMGAFFYRKENCSSDLCLEMFKLNYSMFWRGGSYVGLQLLRFQYVMLYDKMWTKYSSISSLYSPQKVAAWYFYSFRNQIYMNS